jgi:NAD-dependent dihydropyrimidine dehydrogenase PreA subunit
MKDRQTPMRLDFFIEGPLLRFVFAVFLVGIAARIVLFLRAILESARSRDSGWSYVLVSLGRSLFPFHMGIKKRPVYALIRYVFHICLFVVPIFLFGHIVLWEESRFEWGWTPLPDIWADRLTLLVLALCLTFLLRRIIVAEVRRSSDLSDCLFIFVISMPFLTGYLFSHGMPGSLPLLEKNMWTLHVLSGEVVLMSAAFLFCRTRLVETKCTGCAACVLSCPTGTLEAEDKGTNRAFHYSLYQCICCGSCIGSCPEDAAELRHEVSLRKILPKPAKLEIRSVRLEACEQCSALFVPEPQLREVLTAIGDEYPRVCSQCRKRSFSNIVSGLALSKDRPKVETHRTLEST